MPREKNRPRGRPTWVSGTKLTFLSQYSDDWKAATDTGHIVAGRFYTKVTKRFIKKYSWHFDRWSDKECPDPDPETIDDDDDQQGLTDEEITKRQQYFQEMRGYIMAWYHSYHSKVDSSNTLQLEQVFSDMADAVPKAPRRMRMTQFYSKRFYDSRIKPAFEQEWAATSTSPEESRPSRINVLNAVTSRLWENEPAHFKTWLQDLRDAEHERELKEHEKVVEEMKSAPDPQGNKPSALNNAGAFLQPFADLISQKYGAAVSILMVCPISSNTGNIELRSVHSGVTDELVPKIWPVFDREGFDGVQKSMVNFGKHVFTASRRNLRRLDGSANPVPNPSTSSVTENQTPVAPAAAPNSLTESNTSPDLDINIHGDSSPVAPPVNSQSPAIGTPSRSHSPSTPDINTPQGSNVNTSQGLAAVLRPSADAPDMNASQSPTAGTPPPFNDNSRPSSPSPQLSIIDIPSKARATYDAVLKDANRWGSVWVGCLQAFVAFEQEAGFSTQDNRLPTKFRPKEFSEWFKIGRKTSGSGWDGFCNGNPDDFVSGWKLWWSDIQPEARKEGVGGALSKDPDIDWGVLRKPGANGIFLVLVGLLWWRFRLEDDTDGTTLPVWENSVKDVTWVLGCLKNTYRRTDDNTGTNKITKSAKRGTKRKGPVDSPDWLKLPKSKKK